MTVIKSSKASNGSRLVAAGVDFIVCYFSTT
jgi:hypothetical protein